MDHEIVRRLRERRQREQGELSYARDALLRLALLYPSPYRVAMSSLGYLQIYRLANERKRTICERAVLPDPDHLARHRATKTPLLTIESQRMVQDFSVLGISHAYELELSGIVDLLELAGLHPLARCRDHRDPLVVLGGPITFSNPRPSTAFADVVILGEAEETFAYLLERLEAEPSAAKGSKEAREALLNELANLPGYLIPSVHGDHLPPPAQASDEHLPARSSLWTPDAELSDMLLIEPERGCHRGCTFCVMRRSTNGGMRLVSPERLMDLVPSTVKRVGLVGAAVTDHPKIKTILRELIDDRGLRIGISSLRADRLDEDFVGLLYRGGYRSLTIALDAPSVRLRQAIKKNIKNEHIERVARMARDIGMRHIKVYVIVGLPGETDEDREELVQFVLELKKTIAVVLGLSPFIPKFNTPLADAPFAGESEIRRILRQLRQALAKKVELRGPGAREAYVEYRLAQGGVIHGEAAISVAHSDGSLAAWKKALGACAGVDRPRNFVDLIPGPTRRQTKLPMVAPSL
ncbi:MAG: B12-binding domain-containing radical SAM protein [Myxococcales bacterium]|nr:B12-binding domain-containing radical SAM protein [Myxococcales bacterium]